MIPGSPFEPADLAQAAALLDQLRRRGWRLATAESCTGGLIAGLLTAIPGSSGVVEAGFVTYSNDAKARLLGVPSALLVEHGAVSAPVAEAMAEGARRATGAALAVSATGVAGPGGGSADKPVGLVFVGLAVENRPAESRRLMVVGDRGEIRLETARNALAMIDAAAR